MMAKKETAEQKLLKMIEASKAPGDPTSVESKKASKKLSFVASLKTINKILVVIVILSGILLINEIKAGMFLLNKKPHFEIGGGIPSKVAKLKDLFPLTQRLSYYLANVNRRNLFQPFEEKVTTTVGISEDNRRITEKTASFRLVGVAWLDSIDTASVMIEDTEKEVTYFLRKGEKIGDIIVKTIYANSATLGYENEELIIRYDKSQM